jgi:hypothetical protein
VPEVEKLPALHSPLPSAVDEPAKQYLPAGQGVHAAVVPVPEVE